MKEELNRIPSRSEELDVIDSTIMEQRGAPGILFLSPESRVLHMNWKGWELIKQINETQPVKAAGLLPEAITNICVDLRKLMHSQTGSKDWEQIEVREIAGSAKQPILLRGFGLPDRSNEQSRVLIILESLIRRDKLTEQAKERFRLTTREQSVVQNLAKGWTNKEIACALGITEPTVKAHIKHIMEKTKCTTRTGVLAQILRA